MLVSTISLAQLRRIGMLVVIFLLLFVLPNFALSHFLFYRSLVDTIRCALLFSSFPNSSGQVIQNSNSRFPIYAGVCDGDALLQSAWTL